MNTLPQKTALTIAGFDPSSGAGITADLQVFAAHGVFGTSAISALTVQSTLGVRKVQPVDALLLRETLETLHEDLPPHGIKIGMLGGTEQVAEVVRYLSGCEGKRPVVVLDPVIRSSSGAPLLDGDGLRQLRAELLPLVDVVTPNVGELALLTDLPCVDDASIQAAGEQLALRFGCAVVVTGGDRAKPDDLVFADDVWTSLSGERIETRATHGTGCAFSSSMLCHLLQGLPAVDAARQAKAFVTEAMRSATPRGGGRGPMNLLWPILRHTSH
ncbi:bifunctional hydroxymethylpyrimidine kinase/phosphomethylpyrimidine kinase [Terriglobus sp. TAA 43]|uniref:bifunctional hydroxymethylpyrimidine kinase/phosphomethylpyrimidine kinase n=1 Tax=Terriglobus sp. TAA 43 TaxID=278961 RepID=UPI0006475DFF|nr:bifunctional hydroxymethylpyrimidine kinase/phosphomethylpyrimidine kinase [Terriglobus sp. TAA 43]